mmetsp:Transcript_57795/g.141774  ORF Transcript_57795/g.141774 Transcript_57795/m.141774 type:complete len:123 (-) Transcript_57795:90-458(-)
MFFHAVHLLNHPTAIQTHALGLKGSQSCALAGAKDFGVICSCSSNVRSCPEPAVVGTTMGLNVRLPDLGSRAQERAFLKAHPNDAFLHRPARVAEKAPVLCQGFLGLVAASLPGCPNRYEQG